MYILTKQPFGEYELFRIENETTGNGFSIVPEKGGTVIDAWFGGRSILDGYQTPEELTEGKWGKSAILFPFPNRMRDGAYTWGDEHFSFPINNAATQNAIHGFVRHQAFAFDWSRMQATEASFTISYTYDGALAYYPFPFILKLTFTISDAGNFQTEVQVTNQHSSDIPVGFGWHPYFRLTESVVDSEMTIPGCRQVTIDDRMLPTGQTTLFDSFATAKAIGETFLDNCFLADADYQLSIAGDGRRLTLRAPVEKFPYFQVFTPPHRTCVALEPMTCNVDAFNNKNGLITLAPGATWEGAFSLQVEAI